MAIAALGLEDWVNIAQLIGIPVAIFVYSINQNPDLDVGDIPQPGGAPLTAEQKHRQLIMFCILLSIMERAYLMYQDASSTLRQRQWKGWSAYIVDWCSRPNFAAAVPALGNQFDVRFCNYLNEVASNARHGAS